MLLSIFHTPEGQSSIRHLNFYYGFLELNNINNNHRPAGPANPIPGILSDSDIYSNPSTQALKKKSNCFDHFM